MHSTAPASPTAEATSVLVVGKESVGKSQLIAALSGKWPASHSFRGTTVAVESYPDGRRTWIDTPGILRDSDTATTRAALAALAEGEVVLLVVKATHFKDDLADMLPLLESKRGAVAVTFWDKVSRHPEADATLDRLRGALRVPVFAVDARRAEQPGVKQIAEAIDRPAAFPSPPPECQVPWHVEPRRGLFDVPILAQLLAAAMLFLPAGLGVWAANRFAQWADPLIREQLAGALASIAAWPPPWSFLFGGDYGLVAMFPFLLLWALPTVVVFALVLGLYKSSGWIDRITVALHPITRPFGVGGRDLVRVMMGFGCNVPAVINSRSCSECSRGACISAVAFGSACSYQLPATLAVLAAAGMSCLALPYLALLGFTTLVYLGATTPAEARRATNRLTLMGRDFLEWPSAGAVAREAWTAVREFVRLALPVFVLICLVAAGLQWCGALERLSRTLAPAMRLFDLPGEAGLAIVLGSIRKDGIAIALLDSDWNSLKIPLANPVQVLTAVYLAGVLLPCLVTLLTIGREMSWRFALAMAARQAAFACGFALIVAWVGRWLYRLG